MRITERDEARFWAKVALPNEQGCMLWMAYCDRRGYGTFSLNCRKVRASRVSYTLAYGPIPDGLVVDHVRDRGCRSTSCVAPLYLEAVTDAENRRRGLSPYAINARKTHCPQGHPLSGENLYVDPRGGRRCRTCRKEERQPSRSFPS